MKITVELSDAELLAFLRRILPDLINGRSTVLAPEPGEGAGR
jgi:hypothetical protein